MKKKSNVFKILMSLCVVLSNSHALVIQTMQDWNLRKNSEFKALVVVGNKVQENTTAMGNYKVSKNRANLSISVTHIKKGNDYKTLQSPPNTIKEIKSKLVLKKGTRIVLGGENDSEMSNAIGVSKSAYVSSKNGKGFSGSGASGMGYASGYGGTSNNAGSNGTSANGVNGTSGNNGAKGENGSSGANGANGTSGYQGVGSNPFPPIAGSGNGSSGSSNSGYTPFMSGGGGIGGMGGGFIPFPYSPGLQNGSGANGINGTNGIDGTSGANGSNSANGGTASADSHYTNEFCTAPIRNGNTMNIDIVDRNGSCFKMQAFRNDNVCQYNYDFENMKAIKQTQFYFINRENKSINIGGCVDLYGEQFEFPMYEDANKCKLDTTTNKGYGSGMASFFQTEILFRGLDNLIHVAKPCTDFANVQEQLVKYDNDPSTRTVQRVINQYYINPITKEKVFISHDVVSPLKFSYQTYACGKWQFDNAKLEAYRPTQIRIFDTVSNQYYNVTGCDYTSDMGKVPKIIQPYTKINVESSVKGEDVGDLDTISGSNYDLPQYTTFEIQEMSLNSSQWITTSYCNDGWVSWTKTHSYTGYSQGNLRTLAKWVTRYQTINQGTTIGYIRPRNEGDSDAVYDTYKYYYVSQAQKTLKRFPSTIYVNTPNLSDEYRKNFELTVLSQKLNLNNGVKQLINTQEFTNWQATYYRPNGNGNLCMSYNFSSGNAWKSSTKGKYCSWAQTPNANYSCTSHNNWVVPNN
ncbi:collagen-like protein [Helicobacter pylori]|uniref:collagen-like protein n=1 Tax=Helicobacter pylori TaxID=210 RepID=UPI000FDF1B81|nr:collagen-like protein [Helicobacter pylori]RVZ53771.1 collagen-like protein [Helicobacter pylori]RVZ91998.1 collagen-like protein [Helicobacter pylori]